MPFDGKPNGRFYGLSFRVWAKMATDMRIKYLAEEIIGEGLVEGIED